MNQMQSELNRREFLSAAAVAVVAGALSPLPALTQAAPKIQSTRSKLQPFDYGDVKITGGPLKDQYDHAADFFLKLDDDRILKVYRQTAKLPAPGADMGGWYNLEVFGPGHGLGQWMSALSRFAAAGNEKARAKVKRLVEGFAATLGHGDPFYTHRFPCYIFDKHVLGLSDAFRYAKIESAGEVLKRATEAALPFLPEKALTREEMLARPHKDPSFTLDESYAGGTIRAPRNSAHHHSGNATCSRHRERRGLRLSASSVTPTMVSSSDRVKGIDDVNYP